MADNMIGESVSNKTFNPAGEKAKSDNKLFSPNAQEDPDTVTGDNPQKAWIGGSGKPSGPFGPRGKMF